MFLCDFVTLCPADTYEVCRVATNLPAYQISVLGNQYDMFAASRAVDSDRRTNLQYCSLTNLEVNPWWMVDLGIPLTVTGVFFTSVNQPGAQRADV